MAIGHYHCPAWNEFSVADTRLSPATLDAYEARSRFIALCVPRIHSPLGESMLERHMSNVVLWAPDVE